jgi:hypothetical protein
MSDARETTPTPEETQGNANGETLTVNNGAGTPDTSNRQRPKAIIRSVEKLDQISTKAMSDTEMRRYIEHLRDQLATEQTKNKALTENCTSAFNKAKYLEDQNAQLTKAYQSTLAFIKQAIGTCHSSILLAASNILG